MCRVILLIIILFCMNTFIYANTILEKKPKLYAIVIGIGEYPNANFSSKFAKNDANEIYKRLKQQIGYQYTEGSIQLLNSPEQTTKAAIQQTFAQMLSQTKKDDIFILYIIGETGNLEDKYYLLTSKTKGFSTEQLKSAGLSLTEIKNLIVQMPITRKLVLFDTSMSDSLMKAIDLFAQHKGIQCKSGMILTAGRYTIEGGFRGHSLFTYAVLDALSGIADTNKNGFIESNELAQYVEASIPMIAKQAFNRRQIAYIDRCGGNLKFKQI